MIDLVNDLFVIWLFFSLFVEFVDLVLEVNFCRFPLLALFLEYLIVKPLISILIKSHLSVKPSTLLYFFLKLGISARNLET